MTKNWLLALVAGAAMGIVFGACGEGEGGDITCSSDGDCLTGEVCAAGVCAVSCEAGADCPSSAQTCAALNTTTGTDGGATGPSVCQCSTTALCNSEGQEGLVCQNSFRLCTPPCGTDTGYTCPTGYTCEADGQCAVDTGCTSNADCNAAANETCNTTTGVCEAPAACDPNATTIGTGGAPSTCNYGEKCEGTACTAIVQGTCTPATGAPAWSSSTTGRPIITSITGVGSATSDGTSECAGGGPKSTFTVRFYSATPLFSTGTFNTWKSQVRIKFTSNFVEPAFEETMVPVNANVGEFKFGVCGRQSGTGALYVTLPGDTSANSNVACVTW